MLDGLMRFLEGLAADPVVYIIVFFLFCFLAAVILPIPVELGLIGFIYQDFSLFNMGIFPSFIILALVMGLGKGIGSWVVFYVGLKIEDSITRWFKWNWFKKLTELSTRFCQRFSYIGVFLILTIPIMPDTVPLYIFAISNKDREVFEVNWFVLTNFLSGFARAIIVGIVAVGVVRGLWG